MIRGAGMIVFVDDRESVSDGYYSWFGREGVALASFSPTEFDDWVTAVDKIDIDAIEAFLIGRCESRPRLTQAIKKRTEAAVIAVNDGKSLEDTLKLFDAGVDDVLVELLVAIDPLDIRSQFGLQVCQAVVELLAVSLVVPPRVDGEREEDQGQERESSQHRVPPWTVRRPRLSSQ